ncbi:hypothetical protein TD95_003181 [Thielaviopsis punctulata]|uniref:HCP-like protein n=1 Tax=Thielaviopsis punctulata TaxID=72032 RepID=A0A0F4Z9T3_9PEZI|nr:hypothetical protein TD95_003181 [Thielaviopsis punctulata]
MGLRDIIQKKDAVSAADNYAATIDHVTTGAEFTFLRSDTLGPAAGHAPPSPSRPARLDTSVPPANGFLSPASADPFSTAAGARPRSGSSASTRQRLSQRLHLSRSPAPSDHVPANLPAISTAADDAEWEQRATMLAMGGNSRPTSPGGLVPPASPVHVAAMSTQMTAAQPQSNKELDDNIQLAIRLHEEGNLAQSTALFGRLANPDGANNPLSQVLYGLALRHGWGCAPDPQAAVSNLGLAAANAAAIEQRALQEGKKQGGPAKGELVLAIYELANCFRNGWGVERDPVAAKQYYETAANLGDTDAMNEVALCYLQGFGCRKDKFAAARYYRLAEKAGNKTLGNSWIWKEKYDPEQQGKKKGLFSFGSHD